MKMSTKFMNQHKFYDNDRATPREVKALSVKMNYNAIPLELLR